MSRNKKYYWMKLKEDFFEDDTIEWLEEQPNGKEYALFYLKLCLKSLKSDGVLIRKVGDMLVPYDAMKLSEMTRTDVDTVVVAMELFQKIKLVEILENGEIYLSSLQDMVGMETSEAQRKRLSRQNNKNLGHCPDIVPKVSDKRPPEIEKEIEIEKEKDKKKSSAKRSFTPPTLQEVQAYCRERGNSVDPQRFLDFYEAKGWMIGKNKMKDWKAAVRTWERQDAERTEGQRVACRQGASAEPQAGQTRNNDAMAKRLGR